MYFDGKLTTLSLATGKATWGRSKWRWRRFPKSYPSYRVCLEEKRWGFPFAVIIDFSKHNLPFMIQLIFD